jgi:hypothetical protein
MSVHGESAGLLDEKDYQPPQLSQMAFGMIDLQTDTQEWGRSLSAPDTILTYVSTD